MSAVERQVATDRYDRFMRESAERRRKCMSRPKPQPILPRRSDFEEHLGGGLVRIFEGHPGYCPIDHEHAPHEHAYRYLDNEGQVWRGYYRCDGEPMTFAKREASDSTGRGEPATPDDGGLGADTAD